VDDLKVTHGENGKDEVIALRMNCKRE